MKKFIALLLVLVLVFTLVACGGGDKKGTEGKEDPGKTESEKKEEGKTEGEGEQGKTEENQGEGEKQVLHLIETSNIPSMVSWTATDTVSFLILGNVESGLVNYGVDAKTIEPDMAESWDVSDDGLEYTFHLRDANWVTVDGQVYAPVTAQDFVYAWKNVVDPKQASQYSFMLATAGVVNGREAVELSEALVNFNKAKSANEEMKESDFNDIEAKTPEQQLEEDKKELEAKLAEATEEADKDAIQKQIDGLDVANYEEIKAQSAKEQFDAAKAKAEADLAETQAALEEKYGSLEEAEKTIADLIDNLGVEAVDEKTLKVTLADPVPYFVDLMTFPTFFPVNQKFVEEKADKYGTSVDTLLYNGAYIFKEWTHSERHLIEKNPEYWMADQIKLDAVDFRVIEGIKNDTAVQMYLDGEIDSVGLSGENVEKYGNRPDTIQREDTVIFYLEINQGKGSASANKALLSNVKARKAINMAYDKKYITDKLFANGSIPADYIVPKGFTAFDGKDFRDVAEEKHQGGAGYNSYNPEEAKKLWEEAKSEAGVSGVELELLIFQGESASKVGTHIKNELEQNLPGLSLNIEALPFSEKIKRAETGEYELNFAGWGPDYPDAMTFLDLWLSESGHNSTGYKNEEFDALIESCKSGELLKPANAQKRFEEMVKAEEKLLGQDQVISPMYQRGTIGLRNPKIKGVTPQKTGPDVIYKYGFFEE